jgi:hypothetical protein
LRNPSDRREGETDVKVHTEEVFRAILDAALDLQDILEVLQLKM